MELAGSSLGQRHNSCCCCWRQRGLLLAAASQVACSLRTQAASSMLLMVRGAQATTDAATSLRPWAADSRGAVAAPQLCQRRELRVSPRLVCQPAPVDWCTGSSSDRSGGSPGGSEVKCGVPVHALCAACAALHSHAYLSTGPGLPARVDDALQPWLNALLLLVVATRRAAGGMRQSTAAAGGGAAEGGMRQSTAPALGVGRALANARVAGRVRGADKQIELHSCTEGVKLTST